MGAARRSVPVFPHALVPRGRRQRLRPAGDAPLRSRHSWLHDERAVRGDGYTLAQVAPGPNIMYIPLVGWHIPGWLGALATLAATLLPSATLTLGVAYLYKRHPKAAFGLAIRRGIAPITIGLVFASGWILLPAVHRGLARLRAHGGHGGRGDAHIAKPAVGAYRRRDRRNDRSRLSPRKRRKRFNLCEPALQSRASRCRCIPAGRLHRELRLAMRHVAPHRPPDEREGERPTATPAATTSSAKS